MISTILFLLRKMTILQDEVSKTGRLISELNLRQSTLDPGSDERNSCRVKVDAFLKLSRRLAQELVETKLKIYEELLLHEEKEGNVVFFLQKPYKFYLFKEHRAFYFRPFKDHKVNPRGKFDQLSIWPEKMGAKNEEGATKRDGQNRA